MRVWVYAAVIPIVVFMLLLLAAGGPLPVLGFLFVAFPALVGPPPIIAAFHPNKSKQPAAITA
jgi:hypothetical protein